MGKELYTWEQVRAYGEIALHNLTKSANEINMRNFKKCIDPLQTLYAKDGVEGMAEYLMNKYNIPVSNVRTHHERC